MRFNFGYIVIIVLFLILGYGELKEKENPERVVAVYHARMDSLHHLWSKKLENYFRKRYKRRVFTGTVLFAEEGEEVFKGAFGYTNRRKRSELIPSSSFQLASVSKPLTATAVLMLVNSGKISLEDNVKKFFPAFPYEGITVRMLLSHRSGLPNYMYFADRLWPSRRIKINNRQVLELMIKYKPDIYYIPDYRYNYSNTNYALLALLVEKVSGLSFAEYMEKNIFTPLGMDNSFVYGSAKYLSSDKVTGYDKRGRKAENTYLNGVVGDKGIYSSVEDLFKFSEALFNGKLLPDSLLAEAYEPQHKDLRIYDNYGLGWRIDASDPHDKVVYHSGWWKGFRTYFIRKLGSGKTVVILTNTERLNGLSIARLRRLF